jgi:hypothetical protein
MEMLGIMYEVNPYGHFLINGKPPTDSQPAFHVRVSIRAIRRLKDELLRAGVPSIDGNGRL